MRGTVTPNVTTLAAYLVVLTAVGHHQLPAQSQCLRLLPVPAAALVTLAPRSNVSIRFLLGTVDEM